jgi:membrane-bound lytic murein transglycosylase C
MRKARISVFTIAALTILVFSFTPFLVLAQDPDDELAAFDKQWQDFNEKNQAQWDAFEREQQKKWQEFKTSVDRKWDFFLDSTKKTWVDYNQSLDARSEVNFEKGKIEIDAIVAKNDVQSAIKAQDEIFEQMKKIFSAKNPAEMAILLNQLKNKKGEVVTPDNLDEYIKKEVIPNIKVEPKPYKAQDGVERRKYSANLTMVSNHLKIRAQRYMDIVHRMAARLNIEPQLILAVIHTESYFDPMAKSSAGAYGLMQLVPRYGGHEAYVFLYKQDKMITPEYLYNPKNNIELGVGYLYLLRNKHFSKVKDPVKNRYATICGYNCGPGPVISAIRRMFNFESAPDTQVYDFLRQNIPKETKEYIRLVTERMKLYEAMY